jgi:ArsR family transcriptional regulator
MRDGVSDYAREARLFKLLMHPVRLAILDLLRAGEACVCELEAGLHQRQAYVSQQLRVLREAGLIEDRREGWNVFYRLVDPGVLGVLDAARAALDEAAGQSSRPEAGLEHRAEAGCHAELEEPAPLAC